MLVRSAAGGASSPGMPKASDRFPLAFYLSLSSLIGKVAVFGNGPILGGRIYTSTCIYYNIRPCGDHDRRDRSLELMSCTALGVSMSLITGLTR